MKHLLALIFLCLPGVGLAQSEADQARIAQMAEDFATATEQIDVDRTFDMMPPTMIEGMAARLGIDREQLRQRLIGSARDSASKIAIQDVEIDADAMTWHKTRDDMDYALLPTTSVVEIKAAAGEGQPSVVRETSSTIALKDQGEWRLVRLGSPVQQQNLIEAFPALQDENLPTPELQDHAE